MNALELANKLEQGHWEGGTREQAATMLRQQQVEIDRLKFRIENSESVLKWENDGLKRQIQLFEDALYNTQEKIETLEDDKVLHDEAYLSQMKEIETLKVEANKRHQMYIEKGRQMKVNELSRLLFNLGNIYSNYEQVTPQGAFFLKQAMNVLRQQQAEIEALKQAKAQEYMNYLLEMEVLKKDLLKYDRLAWDDLNKEKNELTMSFDEMYPIAEKHLGHAIGLYNWKIFGDAILRKAQEK